MMKRTAVTSNFALDDNYVSRHGAETSSTVGMRQPSAADMNSLTDMRVGIVKAALQLTPDQEKYWPAVEEALRTRAKNQQATAVACAPVTLVAAIAWREDLDLRIPLLDVRGGPAIQVVL